MPNCAQTEFLNALSEKLLREVHLVNSITKSEENWIQTSVRGYTNCAYRCRVQAETTSIEIRCTPALFGRLRAFRSKIDRSFGPGLTWCAEPTNFPRVLVSLPGGIIDEQNREETYNQIAQTLIKLDRAIRPYLREVDEVSRIDPLSLKL